jgi:hypothetical protein
VRAAFISAAATILINSYDEQRTILFTTIQVTCHQQSYKQALWNLILNPIPNAVGLLGRLYQRRRGHLCGQSARCYQGPITSWASALDRLP